MGKLYIFVVMADFSHVYVLGAQNAVTVLLKGARQRFMRLTLCSLGAASLKKSPKRGGRQSESPEPDLTLLPQEAAEQAQILSHSRALLLHRKEQVTWPPGH